MSDKEKILEHLRQHKSITPLQALELYGTFRLGARIWDLRHDGHRIDTEIIHGKDRNGEDMRFAKYTLNE